MNETANRLGVTLLNNQEQNLGLLEKLLQTARPSAVYGEPITAGEHTMITASEVSVTMAFGYSAGVGPQPASGEATGVSGGSGGGGGGFSMGRPIAIIDIGPDGVTVREVVDPTKIALAFFTLVGSILWSLRAMRQMKRG